VIYGGGKYSFELVDGWAKLHNEESFIDVCGIAVDRQDQVYILDRGKTPLMVFNRDGDLISSWGEGYFNRAHGICIGPDSAIYCTDDKNHTVTKFDKEGNVLMTLGTKGRPSDT
jgi:hypothetical protein